MPMLTPVTIRWSLPFATYHILLENRIVYHQLKNKEIISSKPLPKIFGESATLQPNTNSSSHKTYLVDTISSANTSLSSYALYVALRSHINFAPNAPFAFVLAGLAELKGTDCYRLNLSLGTFFGLGIAPVGFGLCGKDATGVGRIVGYYGMRAVMAGLAGYAAWLVRGYWEI